MPKTEKTPNYSEEMVATAKSTYEAMRADGASNKNATTAIGVLLGKTPRSIISKLTREGVYVKDEPGTPVAAQDNGPSKKDILSDLRDALDAGSYDLNFDVDGLKGATKPAIAAVLELVNALAGDQSDDANEVEFQDEAVA